MHLLPGDRLRVAARQRILERTARSRDDAKAGDVKFGRKPTSPQHQQKEARKRLEAGETQRSVACSNNVSQSTISRLPPCAGGENAGADL
jgi:DNA invertase Pin-like site-specific DNA recombinase